MTGFNRDQMLPICEDCGDTYRDPPEAIAARKARGGRLPTRCLTCRTQRRDARNARMVAAYATGPVGPPVSAAPGPASATQPLHQGRCMACGRDIRVPFRPRADRPLYCRPCLDARQGR